MSVTRPLVSITAVLVLAAGCSDPSADGESRATDAPRTTTTTTAVPTTTEAVSTSSVGPTEPPTTDAPATTDDPSSTDPDTSDPATTDPATTDPDTSDPDTSDPATSTDPTTSTTVAPTTTVPEEEAGVYDPVCVVVVRRGDTFPRIARTLSNESPDPDGLRVENGILQGPPARGVLLDVCVGNGIDDITGEARADPGDAIRTLAVIRQQEKLNELFAGYGIRELLVDGVSGPVTRQRLCAFRLSHNLPVTLTDMEKGSDEEKLLMAATELTVPYNEAILAPRWALIDQTCQIMFVGEGPERLTFVFPTSTGLEEFPTRLQKRSAAFRFNPALDNAGWHNSTTYPVAEDNPLNGNMYKPIYFDNGQAIHGANSVPTYPASHGCARLRVEHQDILVNWLGLADDGPMYSTSTINLAVTVQGVYG